MRTTTAVALAAILLVPVVARAAADDAASLRALKTTCDAGTTADCVTLGDRYERGRGVAQDPLHASLAFRQACDGGSAEGCFRLGRMHERGSGVVQDLSAATTLFEKSCKAGHAPACEKIEGYVERAEKEPEGKTKTGPAVHVGQKARPTASCGDGNGNAEACYAEGLALFLGDGVTKDEKRGLALLEKSCAAGHEPACESAAALRGKK